MRHRRLFAVPSVFALLLAAAATTAGPLNPPAGPVAPTPGPEPRTPINSTNTPGDADSVYRITQPGSYYLTERLSGQSGKHGIEIALASQGVVTIDLNGFEVVGGLDTLVGLTVTNATPTRVTLRSGTVRFWDEGGVNFSSAQAATIEGVRALNNFGGGLITTRSRILNCEASSNIGHGISAGDSSVIEGCTTRLNTQHGIYADEDCTVLHCETSANTQSGVYIEYQGRVVNTNAASNEGYGIGIIRNGSADGCMVTNNLNAGIYAQGGRVRSCSARDNRAHGLYGVSTQFDECFATGTVSTTGNNGSGIYANGGSVVNRCLASSNALHGIGGGGDVQVLDSKSQYNGGAGIQLTLNGNTVRGNTCISNGITTSAAGIHMLASGSLVEGNRVTGTDKGIQIDGADNVIRANWCSGNTINWQLAANNVFGQIIDRTAVATPAVSGNSAAGSMSSTDPHANFTY